MKPKLPPLIILLDIVLFHQSHAKYINFAEKCGSNISDGKLEWRGDYHLEDSEIPLNEDFTNMNSAFNATYASVLDPDGNGTIDLTGGYHDAGDHVQFGLLQSYSSQTLEWSLYEFPQSFKDIRSYDHTLDLTKWASDYYLKCTYQDSAGDIVAFCYQAGEGSEDHNYWGPPELQSNTLYPRKSYFATAETPASDQCAGAAASLAISYLNRKDTDATYANTCLETAIKLYYFAVANRGLGYSGGFYNSSFDEDELALAAVWLYLAKDNYDYIEDITSIDANGLYTGWLKRIISSEADDWQNIRVHSWDTKWGGLFAKLAPVTNDENHWYIFSWNIEYWSNIAHEDPSDTNFIQQTPAGFSWIAGWGSVRYNAAAEFCALVYCKTINRSDFLGWAESQMEYIMGNSPLQRPYIVGYSDNYASHPHHRASHGSSTNSALTPIDHKHVLWGALVGGPNVQGNHVDDTNDYMAIDYNAWLVGTLARHYFFHRQGNLPLENFPPLEEETDEYFVEAKLEQENSQRTQITISINNATIHAPRIGDDLKAQYYFDISEMISSGQTIDDLSLQVYYEDEFNGKAVAISGPFEYNIDSGIYYYEFEWELADFYGDREIQFALIADIDGNWNYNWDPSNDFSREGIDTTLEKTQNISVFVSGVLYSGLFPGDGPIKPIAVTGVSISPSSPILLTSIHENTLLSATVVPNNVSNLMVIWSSSDEAVASVDDSGLVQALSNGITTITTTTTDGNFEATNIVTVAIDTTTVVSVDGISLTPTGLSLAVGETSIALATVSPSNASNQNLNWSSDNPAIARIDAFGNVTGVAVGATLIIATTEDGRFTDSIAISVIYSNNTGCDFGTPTANALPSINASFDYVHVIGNGPDLSNISNLTINWDLSNNGLWQLPINTTDGLPNWWNDLLTSAVAQFDSPQPSISFSGSGFSGLDGDYFVAIDHGNFVLDHQSAEYSIYFSNSSIPPCESFDVSVEEVLLFPNPFSSKLLIETQGVGEILNIEIYDFSNQLLFKQANYQYDNNTLEVVFDGELGLYQIQIETTEKTIVHQTII